MSCASGEPSLCWPGLAVIVLMIAVTNLFHRLNVTTKQVAGAWG
jgi:hypothetical protein